MRRRANKMSFANKLGMRAHAMRSRLRTRENFPQSHVFTFRGRGWGGGPPPRALRVCVRPNSLHAGAAPAAHVAGAVPGRAGGASLLGGVGRVAGLGGGRIAENLPGGRVDCGVGLHLEVLWGQGRGAGGQSE